VLLLEVVACWGGSSDGAATAETGDTTMANIRITMVERRVMVSPVSPAKFVSRPNES
jgi:hypothetical protein